MSRKRRTRQQKIIAQLRKKVIDTNNLTQDISSQKKIDLTVNKVLEKKAERDIYKFSNLPHSIKKDYSYVIKDAKKTGTIIFIILSANSVLFFLVRNNILNIKF